MLTKNTKITYRVHILVFFSNYGDKKMATLEVLYKKDGDKQIIETGNKALGDFIIDTAGIPAEERNGTAKQFLCASALYCYCNALMLAMDVRGFSYKNITAKAILEAGNNAKNVSRVLEITLEVHVEIDEDDLDAFDRIQKVMRNGCLVTSSLHEGIEMKYNLIADFDDKKVKLTTSSIVLKKIIFKHTFYYSVI